MRTTRTLALVALLGALMVSVAPAQLQISLGVRETGSTAPIGEPGGTSGSIEWVDMDNQTLTLDGTWQLFTFDLANDPISGFTGDGMLDGDAGTIEHLRIKNTGGVTGPITLWFDCLIDTTAAAPVTVQDWESNAVGEEVTFQEPGFSGSTSGNVTGPGSSAVDDSMAFMGTQSYKAEFQFVGADPSLWVRYTTFNSSIITGGDPTISFINNSVITFWVKGEVAPPAPSYNENSPEATLTINGKGTNTGGRAPVLCCLPLNETATLELSSVGVGTAAWDYLYNIGNPPAPDFDGPSAGGNFENLWLGTTQALFNGSMPTFSQNLSIPFTPSVPGIYSKQLVIYTPMNVDGFVYSAPKLAIVSDTTYTIGDDEAIEMPLTGPGGVDFYGSVYTSLWIGSNGFVTFGAGDGDFSETVDEFLMDEPRIAMLWDDLSPQNAGSVTSYQDQSRAVVCFEDVPEFSNTGANSFALILDTSTGVGRIVYGGVSSGDHLVGLSPGGGAADPGSFDISSLAPFTLLPIPLGSAFYELNPGDMGHSEIYWEWDQGGFPTVLTTP